MSPVLRECRPRGKRARANSINHHSRSPRFPRKFSACLQASFEIDQYPFSQVINASGAIGKRRDDTYQLGAWVTYDIQKWLFTGLAVNHRERDSTLSGQFNFEDNLVSWNASLKF